MSRLTTLSPDQLKSVERTLSGGTWTITAGAILFSVLTVTPLVERVTPDGWGWTAPILPVVVDAAVVIVIRLDSTVSRLGESGGRWPAFLRWLTGCMTLALNVGDSALKGDLVGVAVHAVAPLLLIVTAEAALAYRRAIGRALDAIERERREQAEQARREQAAREQQQRQEREQREARERADRDARERREREEREQAEARQERREREEREHQARLVREQADRDRERREWEAEQEQQREERAREQAEREELARRERAEAEARDRARQAARSQQTSTARPSANTPANTKTPAANTPAANTAKRKLLEPEARAAVAAGVAEGLGVRELARRTGWSVAWVSDRRSEALANTESRTTVAA
ncbi:DUF2637 domain-containing protein [Streptomyces sp. McG5]|uniref:DUF2637 domain-containing protein n=1 Tax=unclassified Streptomyces TaxID=2593676 RepID=UPI000D66637C|nr:MULTISPECIES: DUF2637 domain-containing protein [unclassified Streptomyces]AWL36647.1 DUF2637 domain-containing protein [Streptomyces sp. SM17]AWL36659.1 DUF2637 domain-containing protein [Streptomyces sp. SM17]MBT2877651.1 DUF2637 domain-containing protein [Streptomyces sp. McG6]MBT2884987.1 DUF2637 domain-containing protein [Streptomyces sp. McG5]MBT2890466.1 DUF2637 domain-containing protein [Streptomyces sp. McG2]